MPRLKCEVIAQICPGGFTGTAAPYEAIEQKLASVLSRQPKLPISKVIMGWPPDKTLYAKTAALLARHNIELYLWFPVFSETGALERLSPLVDIQGRRIAYQSAEDFSFCCPRNPENIAKIMSIFEREFASIPFSGVFLDRIRYPSFGNEYGLRNVLSCFCPECLAFYEQEHFNIEELRDAVSGLTTDRLYDNAVLSRFFALKAKIINNSLETLCRCFREKGLGIGFDVFAPFLSPFVGQDLRAISGLGDFIKPMMYRVTEAPAGLPFETEALLQQTNSAGAQGGQTLHKRLGLNPEQKPFDLDFAAGELRYLTQLSACPVYAGVEINRVPVLAEAGPGYITETIEAYTQTGIQGVALSWNLLDAPGENIAHAAQVIGRINGLK
jgi:hypothetical protein